MNLKYSQIQIVVTSSKYCVKSRNESCVPFLSHCNTFIQSLQLKVFAGKEDLGHEVPQGSSGYREDGESLREEGRPSLALSVVLSKPCRSTQLSVLGIGGQPAIPTPAASHQMWTWEQKTTSCWYFSSPFLFLVRTATREDPASHLPDIFSETLCRPAEPYGSILPPRIPSMSSLVLKEGAGE